MRSWISVSTAAASILSLATADAGAAYDLPVGDGKIAARPQVGSVLSCGDFRGPGRGMGPRGDGPWLRNGRWRPDEKPAIRGSVDWPEARLAVARNGDRRKIAGNGLPNHATGVFPVSGSDPAANFDPNPNRIRPYRIDLSLPADPVMDAAPHCVPMGMIGVMITGVALFNALDDLGRDAPAHEIQDKCGGHPEQRGVYHYHGPSPCVPDEGGGGRQSGLVGYALDGFGIFGPYGDDGRELTSRDLDECHGRTSEVVWDGKRQAIYHYVITRDYPYSIGCFRGAPVAAALNQRPPRRLFCGPGGGRPPGEPSDGGDFPRRPDGLPPLEGRPPPPGGFPPPRC